MEHRHALRVALGLGIPGLALLAAGRPELLVYTIFGAFTGMYGRTDTGRDRTAHQIQAGLLLSVGVALGVALSEMRAHTWVLVTVEMVFATIGSILADTLRLKPTGPFFFIFAIGATATVPAGLVSPWGAIGICCGTALLSVLIGLAASPREPGPTRDPRGSLRNIPPDVRLHAIRYALAVSAAGGVGLFMGFDHANWAMAAAAVPLAAIDSGKPSEHETALVLGRAAHRTTGTLVGLVVTGLLLTLNLPPIALGALVILLLFPTELFMTRHYALGVGFFTPLVMLVTELTDPTDPFTLLLFRGIDTVIGVAAGVAAAILVRGRQT